MILCDPMDCSLPGSSVHGILHQGYWRGLPFPSPGDVPDPGIKQGLLHLPFEPPGNPGDLLRTQIVNKAQLHFG